MSIQKDKSGRLAKEKSPYLLQHAQNPVDWYPWGEEAFQKAKHENKPVFLSIGYSTCHWCHVMAHESFEDQTIAAFLNEHYVAVKVDREERPDIDSVYMTSVMAMAGQGGWPLSVFLTPDKRPFFGGTYFPPHAKWGTPGFLDVLRSIHQSWSTNQTQVITSSITLTEIMKQRKEEADLSGILTEDILHAGYDQFTQGFDQIFGGFGQQPKFPSSHNLSFLLRYHWKFQEPLALEIVESTLTKMAAGGLQDHLGGGFHRYSTDQEWQIPHFEKMLYDQALLSRTYCEAHQVTKNEAYAGVARGIFHYVTRDMQDSAGGFYSAEDADSYDADEYKKNPEQAHKKEGAFFLWRHDEIAKILTEKETALFNEYYGVEKNGNAKFDPHGEFTGKNVLWKVSTLDQIAQAHQCSTDEVKLAIEQSKSKLLKARDRRPRPHLDDKILTDWNGLMIASLAYGSRVLDDKLFLQSAERAALFIQQKLMTPDGKLQHRYREGESAISGTLDDYAFFIYGLLELYEATFNIDYLKSALPLTARMVDLFWDDKKGGFFQTSHESEELIFKHKEIYDGAIPSGNSIAAYVLIRLEALTANREFGDLADDIFRVFTRDIASHPASYAQFLSAFLLKLNGMQEVVMIEGKNENLIDETKRFSILKFNPQIVLMKKSKDIGEAKTLASINPALAEKHAIHDQTTVYICREHQCQKPLTDLQEIKNEFET